EVTEAQAKHNRAAYATRGAKAAGDPVDEADERRVDGFSRVAPAPERALRTDRAATPARLDSPEVAVVRERVQLTPGRPAEHCNERRLREPGELADRPHVPGLQTLRRRGADAPNAFHRQGVEERELAVGRDDEQPVWLGDAARHLREELRPCDPDRDGYSDPLPHCGAQPHGDLDRRAGDPLHPAHVE